MTKKNLILLYGVVFSMMLSLSSCSSDDSSSSEDIPLTADIFQSVVGKKVAFQGLTNNAASWTWDFGDGTTSSEKNPVHVILPMQMQALPHLMVLHTHFQVVYWELVWDWVRYIKMNIPFILMEAIPWI